MIAAEPPFVQQLSESWSGIATWLNDHSARIAIALLFAAGLVGVLLMLKWAGKSMARNARDTSGWQAVIGRALGHMHIWFMVAVALHIAAVYAIAPPELAGVTRIIFVVALSLQGAMFLRDLILGSLELRAARHTEDNSLQSALGLIRLLVSVVLVLIAVIVILANLGVNVSGLIAGLGVGGIAIGLAAQGIFADLFAALSILFDQPFKKGDLIRFDQTVGEVTAIGLKSSRIKALSGEEIVISNTNLLSKELRNFARLDVRRVNQPLGIVYHTALDVCALMSEVLQPVIDACDGCHFVRCGLETFGPSSLDFLLVYDIEASDQADILARKNAVNIAVLRAFDHAGIAFAYPTQTTYTAAPGGALVMPYAQPVPVDHEKRAPAPGPVTSSSPPKKA
jgi:small-conductance mechanosensitive channel